MNILNIKSTGLLVVVAAVGFFSVSCEKETFDNVQTQNTSVSSITRSDKGVDDEFEIQGVVKTDNGTAVLSNGSVEFWDVSTDQLKLTLSTDGNGEFSGSIDGGEYIVKCYRNGQYRGSSAPMTINQDDLNIQINL